MGSPAFFKQALDTDAPKAQLFQIKPRFRATGVDTADKDIIRNIRAFNRYYTVWLNVMNRAYLGTEFSWPESRVLFEIYCFPGISATELGRHLQMDKSYISRLLAKFEKAGLLIREPVPGSRGKKKLWLTETGTEKAAQIDRSGDEQLIEKLGAMEEENCRKLCEAMVLIEKTLRENDGRNERKHSERKTT